MTAHHGGVQAMGNVAKLRQGNGDLLAGLSEASFGLWVALEPLLQEAQLERQADQALLGAVMKVALQALALLLPDFDHTPPGATQLLEARPQLDVKPPVLESDRGRGADRLEQLRLVGERGVVEQRGDGRSVLVGPRGPG